MPDPQPARPAGSETGQPAHPADPVPSVQVPEQEPAMRWIRPSDLERRDERTEKTRP
jgi:hypothetical protein